MMNQSLAEVTGAKVETKMPVREIALDLEDVNGQVCKVTVRQLRIKEYKQAQRFMDDEDEPARLTLCTDMTLAWIEALTPESYEMLVGAEMKVNPGFFRSAARLAFTRNMREKGLGAFISSDSAPPQESPYGTAAN